jgi:DNA-binding winged helix-turn-helix (wHTH) protein
MTKRHIYTFGAFQLNPQQKILLRDGERIPLYPKTLAMLLVLVESSGAVITKDELLAKVWPDTFVEESNLTKNMSLLRKSLSNGHDHSDYIETIPTVGYRFVEPVQRVGNGDAAMPAEEETLAVPASPRRLWLWSALALALFVGASLVWFR